MELFNSSQFSSLDDAVRDFEVENISSKKKVGRCLRQPYGTHSKVVPAWDNGSAFPEVSSKNFKVGDAGDGKSFKLGARCEILTPKKYSGEKGHVCGCHDDGSPEFWVKLDNYDLQIRVCPDEVRFLEETEIISTAAPKTGKSKISDCWYTPPEIIALIQQCLEGITLDPCADDGKHIESCYHLTTAEDGLSHQWFGRVFMNPPYSCPGVWIAKLQEEFNCGRVEEVIALMPVATDTKWFHPLISSNLICFWKGRIKFLDVNYQPKMPARQSHCLIYWGKNQSRFRQVFSPFGTFNLSEEKGAMSPTTLVTNVECNLNTPVSLQESPVLNSELKQPESVTSLKQNYSLKTTPTLKQSSNTDFLVSPSIATLKTTALNQENLTSIQSVSPAPEPQLQATELDLITQNQACGLKPCGALQTDNQTLQSSKIPQDLSTEDYEQCLEDSEWQIIAGTLRKSYQLRNSEVHTKEKDFSLLPTPTTYAKGSTGCRPAGQTRLEQRLRTFIMSGDKLNSAVPGWMMGFPVGWVEKVLMDGGEAISIQLPFTQEYATTLTNAENVTTSTPDQSAPSKQRSQLSGYVTSPALPSEESLSSTQSQSNVTPENFLEETGKDTKRLPSPKRRQRKGCLYKYIENKKLKNGNIASYPRVIGETRDPDNPKHWRWGFNWEEKIDGEWKGRSIGSVPIGALALIQSMQKSNIPLEEIISFIKRSKSKK